MRRALALFVEDRPQLIANAFWLHASWEHVRCSNTDLVFMGTEDALSKLPANVVKIVQQPLADDPSWLDYRYVNSLACLNGPGASVLDDYDMLLRTDVDVFLTPAWRNYCPAAFTSGRGYYSNDDNVRENIRRIAEKFGLRHNGIVDIGSTLYGSHPLIRDISRLATDLCKYIRTVEFKDDPGEWPGWYAGVSLLYATEIAVNHLVPSFPGPSEALDFSSSSDAPVDGHPHLHCYHTDDRFSKFRGFDRAYDHLRERDLDLGIVRDYCTAMALRGQKAQAGMQQGQIPLPRRVAALTGKKAPESWRGGAFGRSRGRVREWLAHCADPLGPRAEPPRHALSPAEAADLVAEADLHGVLPATLRNFAPFRDDAAFAAPKAEATARRRAAAARSLMLRAHGEAILGESGALPLLLVKGATFARKIYPEGLRGFTDIDLLVAPEAGPKLALLLARHGFRLVENDPGRQEWKWLHRVNNGLMVEVHTNLVHHPGLRAAMSMTHADLAGIAEGAAAQLGIAIVHGATHGFERLQNVVDVYQAARALNGAEEERRFDGLMKRTGARFAAVVGLDLAHRLSGEPRCRELAVALGPVRRRAVAGRLMSPTTITSAMSDVRSLYSWRRQAFRALLKDSSAGSGN